MLTPFERASIFATDFDADRLLDILKKNGGVAHGVNELGKNLFHTIVGTCNPDMDAEKQAKALKTLKVLFDFEVDPFNSRYTGPGPNRPAADFAEHVGAPKLLTDALAEYETAYEQKHGSSTASTVLVQRRKPADSPAGYSSGDHTPGSSASGSPYRAQVYG